MCGARCGSVAAVVARGGVAWKAAGVWLEEEAPLTLLEAAVTGERQAEVGWKERARMIEGCCCE